MEDEEKDDGSLGFLNIPRDENNRSFNCEETTQSKLMNTKGNYQIFPIAESRYDKHGRALDYVGYKFFRTHKLMRKSIKQRFARAVVRLNKHTPCISDRDYKMAIAPWLGWAKHSNSKHLLKTLLKERYESIL